MNLILKLRHEPAAQHVADAWFINGNDPTRWLDELARTGLAQTETRLHVISAPNASRITHHASRVSGLLVVPGAGSAPSPSPAAIPCRLLAGRLFIPADAVLHPPVTEAEIRELCPWPIAFLHPTLGL